MFLYVLYKQINMTMNKILAILIFVFCIQTMNAQTTLSINFLKSNKWMIIEDGIEDGKKDTTVISFDSKKMYTSTHYHFFHPIRKEVVDKTIKIDYVYYLSDAIFGNYDATKVGKATSGKYITFHNVTSSYEGPNGYSTFEVTRSSNSEIVLTLCSFASGVFDQIGRKLTLKKKQ